MPSSKTVDGVTATYIYDDFGRLLSETSGDITKNYTYDNNSNLLSIRVLNGADTIYSMDYTYDILNRLSAASAPDMTGLFAYTPNGNIASYTIDGITTSYTYDNGGLLTGIEKGDELSETYTYAHNGNKILTLGTGTGIARNEYAYDGMGRLVHETADAFSASYTYDAFGNRATMQQTKDGVTSNTAYTYDLNNRLTYLAANNGTTIDEITYTYDNAGNMLYKIKGYFHPTSNTDVESISLTVGADPDIDAFSYNALGQLVSADMGGNVSYYTYDADGIRSSVISNGVTTNLINLSGSVIGEITPNGTTVYYRAGDRILYSDNGTTNTVYTYNGHGDVIKVGTSAYTYDAFGNPLAESTDGQHFMYCGEYYDQETGMIYLRNRYYDPSIGRFISEDPIRDGLNWYVYCAGNPVRFKDPWGLVVTEWDKEHCTYAEIKELEKNTKEWESGSEAERERAAESSKRIRLKYLTENDTLLDNGYVETICTDVVPVKISDGAVKINTQIRYKRIYTDRENYLQLLNVDVDVSLSDGYKVDSMYITNGQADIRGTKQTSEFSSATTRYLFTPNNWGSVVDVSGGGFTIVGTSVNLTVKRGKTTSHNISIINQVYKKAIQLDGEYYWEEGIDPYDILIEGLQRGER